ncbi:MAG: class I SAM-dependent DNA methyltransferase [Elusimicrobia bacterium]|nr:class I SAM-dependent DNA methyltransferase [Elusimicrobiota bacterium]
MSVEISPSTSSGSREAKLAEFVAWAKKNITGDEKGQAQIYLDRLFQAFGHAGVLDVGGHPEFRIRKDSEDGGGVAFADLVWKPVVLIEMKRRGADLQKHYRQAFNYWVRCVPNRPRYVVLCNFDEFRVYDFETQIDTPVDVLPLLQLPERWGPLAFLFPGSPKPNFENDRVAVTQQAADRLATCFRELVHPSRQPRVDQPTAQRFVLQMLVALFAEDIGLLEKYFVTNLLAECHNSSETHDLIGGLFAAMNLPQPASGGRFKNVPYFNGGLFASPARIELTPVELELLRKASAYDWRKVQPEIFGTLFQHSMGSEERHAMGAHFTHPADIMKIVGPTIVDPWHEQIEGAKTLKRLRELVDRMSHFRVLDPACGSGNFLCIAYREMKRLEARLFERMSSEFSSEDSAQQVRLSFLSAKNFYGLDIEPFAVEIAKVTMVIARKLSIDALHIAERALPLDNLDANFRTVDALLDADGQPAKWPKADVIIGNPPFLGAKLLKPERGPDYVKALRAAYPEVPGMADYCVYWFRKAHNHLPPCTKADPLVGRAGLVGTQNIRNNQSRVGGLDQVVKDGTIIEAVENQPWSGEANVHVSIVNWVKTHDKALLPKSRKLWSKFEPSAAAKKIRERGSGPASKEYELTVRECEQISASLSDQTDVSGASRLTCNFEPQVCFSGQVTGHEGFILSPAEAAEMIRADARNREVIHPLLIGRDMLTGDGAPSEWVIDFQTRTMLEASAYPKPFARIQSLVLPTRERKAQEGKSADGEQRSHHKGFLKYWWRHSFDRPEMINLLATMPRYIVCSDTTKRPIFEFISHEIRPDHKLRVFAFPDDYSFGILQSNAHWLWFVTKCSKLKSDYNYTSSSVFDTFPWPQAATVKQIDAVAAAARELRRIRAEALPKMKGGLRALYRTLELPGANPLKDAHAALDVAVLAAYGFSAKKDLLAQIGALNLDIAAHLGRGEAPGVPSSYPEKRKLVTGDCMKAPSLF